MNKRFRQAALVAGIAGAQFVGGALAGRPNDPQFYRGLKQAPFAPPSWAFAPAWLVAKVGAATSTARVARNPAMPSRAAYLALASIDAGIYVTFSYVYFRKRSPLLAAVWTCADAIVTARQVSIVARTDRVALAGLVPQSAWLCIALPVAVYQAVSNPGPVVR